MIISDLDKRVDSLLLDDNRADRWRAIPYETDEFSGVMLGPGGSRDVPDLEIDPGVSGVYRIRIGLLSFLSNSVLRLKLQEDVCFESLPTVPRPEPISDPVFHEIEWREADLTGRKIILEGTHKPDVFPAALAYLDLEPVAETASPEPYTVGHPMAITEDGFGIFREIHHRRPEDLIEPLHAIPETSCMKILLWGAADGDICIYPTKAGTRRGEYHGASRVRHADEIYFDNLRLWREKGWDPMVTVRDYCRIRKWEFHAYVRMEAFATHYPLTLSTGVRSRFFEENSQFHCLDRDGTPVLRLSYAYPEVRDHMLDIFREIIAYEPDGLCLTFIRGVPLVLYEDAMVRGFQERFGIDPRKLDELDERWLGYQADVMNDFVREVKLLLGPGRRLSAIVPGNLEDCRRWGLDPVYWVRERIIDDLYPTGQVFTPEDVHIDAPERLDFEAFHVLGGDGIRIFPMLYPWQMFGADYPAWRSLIHGYLDDGADGYAVWDGNATEERLEKIVDIGCVPRVTGEGDAGDDGGRIGATSPGRYVTRRLRTMNGFRFDRYHHFEVV